MFISERERETEQEQGRAERERDRQTDRQTDNLKHAPGSEVSAQSPMWVSNSGTGEIMTSAEVGHLTD